MPNEMPANRLRELREERGLKIYDIAARLRADPSTIYRWESGAGMVPDRLKLELAELYEVSVAYLMGWSESVAA